MSTPGPGYSITMRIVAPPSATAAGELTSAVGRAGGVITGLDVVESTGARMVIDLSANALSEEHAQPLTDAVAALPGVAVRKVSDRTFLVHLGGKIEVTSKVPLRNRDDLSRAYTPGVARVCMAIAKNPDDARRLTIKRNTVAVVTDGTAVLGLGNIGPGGGAAGDGGQGGAVQEVRRGRRLAGLPRHHDTEEIIRTVQLIAPVYGGINLEDIAAPRCFEIEAGCASCSTSRCSTTTSTARPSSWWPRCATRCGWSARTVRTAGSSSRASARPATRSSGCCCMQGPADIVAVDIDGIVYPAGEGMDPNLAEVVEGTNPRRRPGRPRRHRRRRRVHRRLGTEHPRRRRTSPR